MLACFSQAYFSIIGNTKLDNHHTYHQAIEIAQLSHSVIQQRTYLSKETEIKSDTTGEKCKPSKVLLDNQKQLLFNVCRIVVGGLHT